MPLYEFKCSKCDKKFEKLVALGQEASVECPECNCSKVSKCCSSFGIGGGGDRTASSSNCTSCSTSSPSACSTCR